MKMKMEGGVVKGATGSIGGRGRRRAVSPVIATLLLIAIAVAAGIILYVFVSGLSGQLSSVKSTVTQPLQVTVLKVEPGSSNEAILTLQVFNPNSADVTLLAGVITDNTGVQVATASLTDTVSATTAAVISSVTISDLTRGQTYRITIIGTDGLGNQYTSNPAAFTARVG
jgi:flagellin-like protein